MFSSAKSNGVHGASPATLSKSLRFRSSASAYLNRTGATPTNSSKCTYSFWLKRGTITTSAAQWLFSGGPAGTVTLIGFLQSNHDNIYVYQSDGTGYGQVTTPIYVDTSAWYHVVISIDTTQATNTSRITIYINGIQQATTVSGTITQNSSWNFNSANPLTIGRYTTSLSAFCDIYLSDVYFIDGQALTPSSFGATNAITGQWSPATYSGSYGTNGFHLTFANTTSTTTLGYDTSGNANNWTTNNFSLTAGSTYDSMNDVPVAYSATAANYATWNPLTVNKPNLTNGNLDADGSDLKVAISTIGVSSGKWYWEITIGSGTNTPNMGITSYANDNADPGVYNGVGRSFVSAGGGSGVYKAYTATSTTANSAFSNANTAGATIGFALDCNAGTIAYYVNNTLGYTDSTVATGTLLYPMTCNFNSAANNYRITSLNTGQRAFTYTPPSGYNALNTYNLPTPTIAQGNKYMDATLYTGTLVAQSITNAGSFKPDLVWIKCRSDHTDNKLTDSVRGVTKALVSNSTAAETTDTLGLTAFNSNGFTLGTDTNYNNSGATYVGWQWQAGAGTSNSNTNGSITSTVSASTTSGFSVVTFASAASSTVGHGLGVAPSMVVVKSRTVAGTYWLTYHVSTGATGFLSLNTTDAFTTNSTVWANTAPTSTVFTLGSGFTNASYGNCVAYCFAPVAGFSAFGSYTGNGSATGPFIYTGFRPKYIMYKSSTRICDWGIVDTTRNPSNSVGGYLSADTSVAEGTYTMLNILSNGWQIIWADSSANSAGETYIYMAFASNPFAYSNAF